MNYTTILQKVILLKYYQFNWILMFSIKNRIILNFCRLELLKIVHVELHLAGVISVIAICILRDEANISGIVALNFNFRELPFQHFGLVSTLSSNVFSVDLSSFIIDCFFWSSSFLKWLISSSVFWSISNILSLILSYLSSRLFFIKFSVVLQRKCSSLSD